MFDLNKLVRKNIQELKPYSSARDEFSGTKGVFLDANENPYGDLNRYPDPYQSELKEVLSEQKGIDPKNIFVGNGSDEVIDLLYRIYCTPGKDKTLTFSPTYGMYEVTAAINDIELIKLPLSESFEIDVNKTIEAITNPLVKLTFICSPNNPTGNTFSRKVIERIIQSSSAIVVIDEAYIDFSESGSLIDLVDTYSNLVIIQTMSKAFGLAAARIGFAFANEAIIELLNKVKPPYNVSRLNQEAAIKALKDQQTFNLQVQAILDERKVLYDLLKELTFVKKIYPSNANFLLVQFSHGNQVYNSLVNRKIITRNRNNVARNCIRITIGSPRENQLLIKELKRLENEKSIVY